MNKVTLINNWAFRLLTPPIFAVFIYVLVLLFFGSASKLGDHFFSIEYIICLILCYTNFELWRLAISLCSRLCENKPWRQIIYQSIAAIILSFLATFLLVYLYFKYLVGLVNFTSELSIFIALFIFSSLLYQMVYLSIFLLNYQHQDIINKQKQLKKEADDNWMKFQNKINPQLLYKSLETLITLVHNKHPKSEELVAELSGIYRKILDHNDDLIALEQEINLVTKLNKLVSIIYENKVSIEINPNKETTGFLIPGYLLLLIQRILNESILSTLKTFTIEITIKETEVQIIYKENKSLHVSAESLSLKNENEQIAWYTKTKVDEKVTGEGIKTITIPIINIDN